MGVGHPLPADGGTVEQLSGVGPPPMGVGQPLPADEGVSGVETGKPV